jgi:hypothetical protein
MLTGDGGGGGGNKEKELSLEIRQSHAAVVSLSHVMKGRGDRDGNRFTTTTLAITHHHRHHLPTLITHATSFTDNSHQGLASLGFLHPRLYIAAAAASSKNENMKMAPSTASPMFYDITVGHPPHR